jgi:microcystin-dependent protein
MSEAFLGEIRMFGGNFPPANWALCNGALMAIRQNTALFSLLGTNFGGDGRVTFGLPNLMDTVPLGTGAGPSLTPRVLGETGGSATVALTVNQIAAHTHSPSAFPGSGQESTPAGATWATSSARDNQYAAPTATPVVQMAPVIGAAGGNVPHENRAPYLAVTYIICLNGIFPQRP